MHPHLVSIKSGALRPASGQPYEANRADTQWNQQLQERQYQDRLNQQRYENETSEREYQDKLNQQKFNNDAGSPCGT